eukprot:Partr_v1_DN26548_c1_g1_i1_m3761 putative guanine nucleotide binding protein-like 3
MVAKKHKSKRMSAGMRYKIEKKVSEHRKKARREAKKNPKPATKKKDPGIPNLFPMKEKLLQDIERSKLRAMEDKKAQREARLKSTMAGMAADATKRANSFDMDMAEEQSAHDSFIVGQYTDGAVQGTRDNSSKAYYKEFRKVVENSDVILQVLDARDPMGCRARKVEEMILAAGGQKRIVLILNKIDLVPREVAEKWLKYLRNEFPTVAFKASTQQQRTHLGHSSVKLEMSTEKSVKVSECLGADDLIKLLKNYCRNANIKTSITIGVIGFPNVGKSSVINSLKRSKVCGVGATPGQTKVAQVITLDKNIKLLDCPGIVFSMGSNEDSAEAVLRNCIKVELLEDPIAPVEAIIKRTSTDCLVKVYNVPAFRNTADFLISVAKQRGRLRKNGIADLEGAARSVIQDWNSGKIPYFTKPPAVMQGKIQSSIVQTWSQEFDLSNLKSSEELLLAESEANVAENFMRMDSMEVEVDMDAVPSEDESDEYEDIVDEEEIMSEDMMEEEDEVPSLAPAKKQAPAARQIIDDEEAELNPQHGKAAKKQMKKEKKNKLRLAALASNSMNEDDETYNFSEHF